MAFGGVGHHSIVFCKKATSEMTEASFNKRNCVVQSAEYCELRNDSNKLYIDSTMLEP